MFTLHFTEWEKTDLGVFDHSVIAVVRRTDVSLSETADYLRISGTTVSILYSEWCKKKKTACEWLFCRQQHLVD